MPSHKFVWLRSKNFTSSATIRLPPTVFVDPSGSRSCAGQRARHRSDAPARQQSTRTPILYGSAAETNKRRHNRAIHCYSMLCHSGKTLLWTRCFAHSNNGGRSERMCCMRRRFPPREGSSAGHQFRLHRAGAGADVWSKTGQRPTALSPTTNPLTAAALIYALGAGITAGAGTRLVLQLILDGGF
jgi:hypothetical protein